METSITSKLISQQTICGDNESLELTNNTKYNLNHGKEKTNLEKTQNNLNQASEVYFKYFPLQKMAHTKATVRKGVMMGMKTVPQPHQPRKGRKGKMPKISIKNLGKLTGIKCPSKDQNGPEGINQAPMPSKRYGSTRRWQSF